MPNTLIRDLVLAAAAPELEDSARSSRARAAADAAQDIRDLLRLGRSVIGGGAAVDALIAAGRVRGSTAITRDVATERVAARRVLDELRADADLSGASPRPYVDADEQPFSGVPIIRSFAAYRPAVLGRSPVTPGVPDGTGVVDPDGSTGGTPVTIDDVGAGVRWHLGAFVASLSSEIVRFVDDDGAALLDQAMLDVADTAAETHIVTELINGAGGTQDGSGDLASALTDAESAAGAAVGAAADMMIVSATDWPTVRAAVATSWQTSPAPSAAVSAGCPAGTVVLTARRGLHLYAADPLTEAADTPSNAGRDVTVARPFYVAIRDAAAVQTVTLTAA